MNISLSSATLLGYNQSTDQLIASSSGVYTFYESNGTTKTTIDTSTTGLGNTTTFLGASIIRWIPMNDRILVSKVTETTTYSGNLGVWTPYWYFTSKDGKTKISAPSIPYYDLVPLKTNVNNTTFVFNKVMSYGTNYAYAVMKTGIVTYDSSTGIWTEQWISSNTYNHSASSSNSQSPIYPILLGDDKFGFVIYDGSSGSYLYKSGILNLTAQTLTVSASISSWTTGMSNDKIIMPDNSVLLINNTSPAQFKFPDGTLVSPVAPTGITKIAVPYNTSYYYVPRYETGNKLYMYLYGISNTNNMQSMELYCVDSTAKTITWVKTLYTYIYTYSLTSSYAIGAFSNQYFCGVRDNSTSDTSIYKIMTYYTPPVFVNSPVNITVDITRRVSTITNTTTDSKRTVNASVSVNTDTSRKLMGPYSMVVDTSRKTYGPVNTISDLKRRVSMNVSSVIDTDREIKKSTSIVVDTIRKPRKSYSVSQPSMLLSTKTIDLYSGVLDWEYANTVTLVYTRNSSTTGYIEYLDASSKLMSSYTVIFSGSKSLTSYTIPTNAKYVRLTTGDGTMNNITIDYVYSLLTTVTIDTLRKAGFIQDITINYDTNRKVIKPITFTTDLKRSTSLPDALQIDTSRKVVKTVSITPDIKRYVIKNYNNLEDVLRRVNKSVMVTPDTKRPVVKNMTITADSHRKVSRSLSLTTDTKRYVMKSYNSSYDVLRRASKSVQVNSDTNRRALRSVTTNADTLRWLTGNIAFKLATDTIRRVIKTDNPVIDTSRIVSKNVMTTTEVDTLRKIVSSQNTVQDTKRIIVESTTVYADTFRKVAMSQTLPVDTLRKAIKNVNNYSDVLRKVVKPVNTVVDTMRYEVHVLDLNINLERLVYMNVETRIDTNRTSLSSINSKADIKRMVTQIEDLTIDTIRELIHVEGEGVIFVSIEYKADDLCVLRLIKKE